MMKNIEATRNEAELIRVLCVEDNVHDRELIRHALEKEADVFIVTDAYDREMFEDLLAEGNFDVVLTDFNILGFQGLEVIRGVKERYEDVPVIVVTGTGSEEIAVQSLKEGAEDYIIKNPHHIAQLPNTIIRIMEAQKTRNRLREREAGIRAIIRDTAEGLVLVDRHGHIVFSNPSAERLMGVSPGELDGTFFGFPLDSEMFPSVDLPQRPGGPGTAEMRVSKTLWNGEECFIVAMNDITERIRSELLLKESEERHRTILQTAMDGFWIIDTEGFLLQVNNAYCRMSGYSEQELLSMHISDIEVSESAIEVKGHIRKVMEQDEDRFESRQRRKDGSIFDVEVSSSYKPGEGGRVVSFLRDITGRKEAEEELLRTTESLEVALNGTIQALSMAVEARDPYTAGHQRRVSDLAGAIAAEMGMDEKQIDFISIVGKIHDIGKISVPAEILSKPAKLSETELSLVRMHPQTGFDMLREVAFPWPIADVILQHHERMDGSGYPNGLKCDEILPEARIMAVADVVEAMASHRPYRPTLGIEAALEEIEKNRDRLYDPVVVDACLGLFRKKGFILREV